MSHNQPQPYHNKAVRRNQVSRELGGDPGFTRTQSDEWIHRDTLIALIAAICGVLSVSLPPDQAIRWMIALSAFLMVYCDIAPRYHRHPLFHLFSGLSAAYICLCTVALWQQHMLGKIF